MTDTAKTEDFNIKVREKGATRWLFLGMGGATRLRVHAVRYQGRARAEADLRWHERQNPEHDFKIQKA